MQEDYIIYFERTGGFAGIRTEITIDSKTLVPEEKKKLDSLISHSAFLDFNTLNNDTLQHPDGFTYTITYKTTDLQHKVEIGESQIPDAMKPLVNFLNQKARALRKK